MPSANRAGKARHVRPRPGTFAFPLWIAAFSCSTVATADDTLITIACKGNREAWDRLYEDNPKHTVEDVTHHYVVDEYRQDVAVFNPDFDAPTYVCRGNPACGSSFQGGMIRLSQSSDDGEITHDILINRKEGTIIDRYSSAYYSYTFIGSCERGALPVVDRSQHRF